MDTLGSNCTQQSRFTEARELHEKAIQRVTEILGVDHEDTLTALDNLDKVMSRYFFHDRNEKRTWSNECHGKSRSDIYGGRG
jgi:hypothetical protein